MNLSSLPTQSSETNQLSVLPTLTPSTALSKVKAIIVYESPGSLVINDLETKKARIAEGYRILRCDDLNELIENAEAGLEHYRIKVQKLQDKAQKIEEDKVNDSDPEQFDITGGFKRKFGSQNAKERVELQRLTSKSIQENEERIRFLENLKKSVIQIKEARQKMNFSDLDAYIKELEESIKIKEIENKEKSIEQIEELQSEIERIKQSNYFRDVTASSSSD